MFCLKTGIFVQVQASEQTFVRFLNFWKKKFCNIRYWCEGAVNAPRVNVYMKTKACYYSRPPCTTLFEWLQQSCQKEEENKGKCYFLSVKCKIFLKELFVHLNLLLQWNAPEYLLSTCFSLNVQFSETGSFPANLFNIIISK